jgi:hypothetical protein
MAIHIYSGIPGSGKSLKLADTFAQLLERNKKYYKQSGIKREIVLNLKLSSQMEVKAQGFFRYWKDPSELVKLRDVDVIFDEVATYLDSTQWANVPLEFKRWLQLHRHYGIDIFGTTQEFGMIDISMRRLVSRLFVCTKLFGSRDISATKPPVKKPWGVVWIREVEPKSFIKDSSEYRYVPMGWDFLLISMALIKSYDTTQELDSGRYPALKHIERHCDHCGFKKISHI